MNPRLGSLVAELKRVARDDGGAVWADVAETLQGPRSRHAEVNLSRIERYATEGETVVVPGKVLGSGALRTPIAVGAVDFSASAETKIEQADGEALQLEALLADNPEGANVTVIR